MKREVRDLRPASGSAALWLSRQSALPYRTWHMLALVAPDLPAPSCTAPHLPPDRPPLRSTPCAPTALSVHLPHDCTPGHTHTATLIISPVLTPRPFHHRWCSTCRDMVAASSSCENATAQRRVSVGSGPRTVLMRSRAAFSGLSPPPTAHSSRARGCPDADRRASHGSPQAPRGAARPPRRACPGPSAATPDY